MRVSRLYVAVPLNVGGRIELDEDAAHYVRSVLRLKQDQSIVLFNGQGGEYLGRFSEVSRKIVRVEIEQFVDRNVESPLAINLGLGISRGDRMDWAVQKAVELGVTRLTPLETERCVIKFNDDKKQQRLQHWLHIARHAAEQSGRTYCPALGEITNLADWIASQQGLRVFLDPYAEQSLADLKPENSCVTLLSGPEGGFSEQERQTAKTAGFVPVRMGARILRTETAVLSALTAVQTLWGDFR
ncbi:MULTISPECIES: 16S rRNA (uracil(1498)-N(3))-methyltransferase [Methylomonas]|uniref:Ribosomal RNA small subunit methyltransferase E n=2 Tax=Methylomonas TaxID=416 RepID=A0A126T5M3_9GAMM|nr:MULTISPECIES: 16S rRNA (uracil(1498)-N(3))-methyltransferase [Methylomonas]AMK77391.1 16S rRNA methyltransferase [Methylomonas denitrificans]OAI04986.1 16S rRNA (uracil(1498)-N(3))-methyltransferase [Methylomonas methanica]TCV84570.1 16S rRNA m(3)U-1498 methyltransferase [Methylomonas methanica]